MNFLYIIFFWIISIPISVIVCAKAIFGDSKHLERLGIKLKTKSNNYHYWVVASSVGEVNAAAKLIAKLLENNKTVVLTVTTATGRDRAQELLPDIDILFHPLDIKPVIKKFIKSLNPDSILLIETEIWPVMLQLAFEKGISAYLISGRISKKSYRKNKAFKSLYKPLLKSFSGLYMQSNDDAERIKALADSDRNIKVVGSLKEEYRPPDQDQLQKLREYLQPWKEKIIFTCGSTRPGEEQILLDAFSKLQAKYPQIRLILAPRHPKRFLEVLDLLKNQEMDYCSRKNDRLLTDNKILLLDTLGELNAIYHLADIAFVGGTLFPLGGHSILEPAQAGCPTIFGQYYFNQLVGAELVFKFKLGWVVKNADEIVKQVSAILKQDSPREYYQGHVNKLRQHSKEVIDNYLELLAKDYDREK